jgi:UDP-N-acetylmuramyl tripeptide synthase
VVVNVSADHFGEYGIDSVEDIAEAKLVVAHALREGGTLVLNGGDAVLMAVAARTPAVQALQAAGRLALFAPDADHPALAGWHARGGTICGVRGGRLWRAGRDGTADLGAVAAMPLTLGGAAPHNTENIAAAVLCAHAAGLPDDAVRATLAAFGADPADNPGRLERHAHRGATVLVDYAHNPDGLARLLAVARTLLAPGARLLLLLGQAGNRDDDAIAALARTAAAARPDRVAVKELPGMLRGRAPGEVPALLQRALRAAGQPDDSVTRVDDEDAACAALLAAAGPGDVVVLPVHTGAVRERLVGLLAPR